MDIYLDAEAPLPERKYSITICVERTSLTTMECNGKFVLWAIGYPEINTIWD